MPIYKPNTIFDEQVKFIAKTVYWLEVLPERSIGLGDIRHHFYILKEDEESLNNKMKEYGYEQVYAELNEINDDFYGYTLWVDYYKKIEFSEISIENNIREIATIVKEYDLVCVDSFTLLSDSGDFFNPLTD